MNYLPQLGTHASVQFPATNELEARTIVNRLDGGSVVRSIDGSARRKAWRLEFANLSDTERQAVESFFHAVAGRLGNFPFLDPFQNLFVRSNEMSHAAWVREAPLALTAGASDPMGGTAAVTAANAAAAARRLYQSLTIPAGFRYTLSVYVRAASPALFNLFFTDGANTVAQTYPVGSAWNRVALSGVVGGLAEQMDAGVELPAGAQIQLFGAQLEAQPAASDYKPTGAEGGVYSSARLMQDELVWTSPAPGLHSTKLTIASR